MPPLPVAVASMCKAHLDICSRGTLERRKAGSDNGLKVSLGFGREASAEAASYEAAPAEPLKQFQWD